MYVKKWEENKLKQAAMNGWEAKKKYTWALDTALELNNLSATMMTTASTTTTSKCIPFYIISGYYFILWQEFMHTCMEFCMAKAHIHTWPQFYLSLACAHTTPRRKTEAREKKIYMWQMKNKRSRQPCTNIILGQIDFSAFQVSLSTSASLENMWNDSV